MVGIPPAIRSRLSRATQGDAPKVAPILCWTGKDLLYTPQFVEHLKTCRKCHEYAREVEAGMEAALDTELAGYTPEQLAGRGSLRDDERQVAQKESEK